MLKYSCYQPHVIKTKHVDLSSIDNNNLSEHVSVFTTSCSPKLMQKEKANALLISSENKVLDKIFSWKIFGVKSSFHKIF